MYVYLQAHPLMLSVPCNVHHSKMRCALSHSFRSCVPSCLLFFVFKFSS